MDLTVFRFMAELEERGMRLQAKDGKLGFLDPDGRRSQSDIDFAKAFKQELLDALALDPDSFRLSMAAAVFDASPGMDAEGKAAIEWDALGSGMVRCDFCGFERNREVPRCWHCFPSVLDEVRGPAPRVPARSIEEMTAAALGLTDAERQALRAELASAPRDDPPHVFEQIALDRAERIAQERKAASAGAAD